MKRQRSDGEKCLSMILSAGLMLLLVTATACLPNSTPANVNGPAAALVRLHPEGRTCSPAATNQRRIKVAQELHALSRVHDVGDFALPTFPPVCSEQRK